MDWVGDTEFEGLQVTWKRWLVNNFMYSPGTQWRDWSPLAGMTFYLFPSPSSLHPEIIPSSSRSVLSVDSYFPFSFQLSASVLGQFYCVPLMQDITLNAY